MECSIEDLGINFWRVFLESFAWATLQGFLSTFFSLILGGALGLALSFSQFKLFSKSFLAVQFLGDLFFTLPGVVSSFLFIVLFEGVFPGLTQGLESVIGCHVLFSIFWVASNLSFKMRTWINAGGKAEVEAQAVMGGGKFFDIFVVGPVGRKILRESRSLAPYLFVVFFTSFSTVLILGGGPRNSTPEVMLFYSLLHDFGSLRTWVWILSVFMMSWLLGGILKNMGLESKDSLIGLAGGAEKSQATENYLWGPWLASLQKNCSIFVQSFILIFVCFLSWGFFKFLSFDFSKVDLGEARAAFLGSFSFVGCVALWILFFSSFFMLPLRPLRSALNRFWLLGSGWYAAFFLTIGWGTRLQTPFEKFFVGSLIFSISLLPLISRWVRPLEEILTRSEVEAAKVLGANRKNLIFDFVLPRMLPFWGRIVVLGCLMALGDLALSTLFLGDTETLTTWGRRLSQRYNFSGMSLVATGLFGLSFLGFAVSRIFYRKNMNA